MFSFSYRKSAQKLKRMIKYKPVSARERVIKNTEFVLKYGPFDNFNVGGSELNVFQYFLIDVLLVVIPLTLLVICIITSLTLCLFFFLYSVSKTLICHFYFPMKECSKIKQERYNCETNSDTGSLSH